MSGTRHLSPVANPKAIRNGPAVGRHHSDRGQNRLLEVSFALGSQRLTFLADRRIAKPGVHSKANQGDGGLASFWRQPIGALDAKKGRDDAQGARSR